MKHEELKKQDLAENHGEQKAGGIFKRDAKVEKLKAENAELRADLQRTRADFENFHKNVETRVKHSQALGEKKAILAILPILDDIERAIAHLPADLAGNAWAENVVKMSQNLGKNLAKVGVKRIEAAAGTHFNPEIHEAIQFEEDGEGEEVVVAELRAGYKLHDEVLRAAMVKVGHK